MTLYTMRSLSCCGGTELIGWNRGYTAASVMKAVASRHYYNGNEDPDVIDMNFAKGFYVMSYAYESACRTKGVRSLAGAERINKFARYVARHKLGTVIIAPDTPNPTHRHKTIIRPAMWIPDHEALWKHILEKKYYKVSNERERWGI